MKKMFWVVIAVVFCMALSGTAKLYAADLTADQQKIQAKKEGMKVDAQTGKDEEKALRSQLKDAKLAGDTAKVKELRAQLKTMHEKNVSQMHQDNKDLNSAKKELLQDKKEAKIAKR